MAREQIEGMKKLEKMIKDLGELPQKCVTKAARQGANIALKAARAGAPVGETGNLKKAIKLVGERSKIKGKKTFQVTFNSEMNNVLVKVSKKGKRSYYPASQEFGFISKDGRYIPGYRFMRNSIDEHASEIQEKTVKVLTDEIDKLK